jgi:pyrroline-5-carboxylate reductase
MKKNIIGIIGGGNMGEALIKGLYELKKWVVHVCETNPERVEFLKTGYKIIYEKDISSLVAKVDIIIFAVKPQEMESVLGQIKTTEGKLFISIAAGLKIKYFEDRLGAKARVVRAMPNLPALIGEGITGYCVGQFANDEDKGNAGLILEALGGGHGSVILFDESQMDAVTAVSGSGPAYVFFFVEEWLNAAITLGLGEKDAKVLVCETLIGSAGLLKKLRASKFEELKTLRAKVTSKGGTTQAAMDVLLNGKIDQLMKEALTAAKKRSIELAK